VIVNARRRPGPHLFAVDVLDIHFAVVAGKQNQTPGAAFDLATPLFYGTAFAVMSDVFITAGHVFKNAAAAGRVAIARRKPNQYQTQHVTAFQVFDEIDIALLHCPGLDPFVVPVRFDPLETLADVQVQGFAFGPDPKYLVDVIRGFKGHIVTRRRSFRFSGQPTIYELSFVPPKGILGAPVISYATGTGAVHAVVVGCEEIEIEGVTSRLGVAIDSTELLRLTAPNIVGGAVAQRVFGKEPLPPRQLIETP
jgi:hypothetical protein